MSRAYLYKLTGDNGGAPCVEGGLLSLAICKPMIRASASEGDLVFGFGAKSLHCNNRLIYIARITKKICGDGHSHGVVQRAGGVERAGGVDRVPRRRPVGGDGAVVFCYRG
jgi:hypothetical protein